MEERMQLTPCSKVVVDWILNLAFPFVKQIPRVRLTGYVKTSVKAKWDAILAKAYMLRKEDPPPRHDWERYMRQFLMRA
jgi:hypothetical protein